jgi:lysophospholipase L1-like esterase
MKTPLVNVVLIAGSLILALSALEGILRIRALISSWPNHHTLCCEYDPRLGWRHVPNRTVRFTTPEYDVTERFNSRGVRGPEYSLEKPPGEFRIVILGDSFAEGYTVEFNELFSEILKRRLNEEGHRTEVINLGVAGYSTDQELLLYQSEGKRYRPDLTILMFHDNDVWYNAQERYLPWGRGSKPVFALEHGELRLTNVPVPPPAPARPAEDHVGIVPVDVPLTTRLKMTLSNRSALYRWTRDAIKTNAALASLAAALGMTEGTVGDVKVPVAKEFGVYHDPYGPETAQAWKLTAALIGQLKREARASGSELLVFYVPMRAAVYDEEWDRFKQHHGLSDERWRITRGAEELHDVLKRLKIDHLDPLEDFRAWSKRDSQDSERLYFKRDGHWSRSGHRVAGEILANSVLKHYARHRNGIARDSDLSDPTDRLPSSGTR